MPDLVVSNIGESYLIDRCVRLPWVSTESWSIHLFNNNYIPLANMARSDFVEATFSTYAAKTLTRATWTPAGSVLGRAVTTYGTVPLVWNNPSTPQIIYGYFVDVPTVIDLLFAQRFDTPITISSGTPVSILLQFSGRSESEPV